MGQNDERENAGIEENNRANKTKHIRKEEQEKTIPEALISAKETFYRI